MNDDDDRVAYLAGEDGSEVDDATRADLDELRALLADETLWAMPPAGLEDSIVAAIAAESTDRANPVTTAVAAPAAASGPPPPATVTSLAERRARRIRRVLATAAAVAVLALGGAYFATRERTSDGTAVSLEATEILPDAGGTAHVKRFESGWRILLDATGLPRLDDGAYYQAWLKDADGVLVPIGTFNEGADVVLWAGVSPVRFSTLTVTKERADGDQTSSGQRVLVGTIVLDDAATS
jgi:Anti-sigma-K factor rskA, C-terminal